VDGDPLSYQWLVTARPMGSAAILDNPTTVAPSFLVDKPGTYTVQLIVNDGTADSTPDTITISTLNTRPTAEAGPDQEVHVGEIVQLDGSGSTDAEGDPLLYVWSLATVPAGSAATLTGANTRQATFVPDVAGTYVAQLIVNDGMLDSEPDTATVTVTVLDTTPPPPADLSHITVGPVLNDHITVSGAAGSVEDGAQVTLTNIRTGQSVTVTANADGRNHSGEVTADTVYGLSLQNPDAGWSWLGSFTGYSNGSTLHLPFETAYPTHYFFNASGTQAVSVKDTVSGDHANPFQKIVLDVNVAVGHADFSLGHVESIDLDGTTITSGGYTYSLVNTKEVVGEQVVAHSAEVGIGHARFLLSSSRRNWDVCSRRPTHKPARDCGSQTT
ncbi:MAG: hypothetical protein HY268_03035, partial [Deltaproteobacteria bacterium]|nr:hypothetical protein [Deltaproteobacteria bacterium]